tara:strand:+ start:1169 stop:1318 length:150 start_codon:yes stop_codon:yes gene_type:complete
MMNDDVIHPALHPALHLVMITSKPHPPSVEHKGRDAVNDDAFGVLSLML